MKIKLFLVTAIAIFALNSCSKSSSEIIFGTTWEMNSYKVNNVETLAACDKDDACYFCYCGILTIKKEGTKCSETEPTKIEKLFKLSNDSKSMQLTLDSVMENYTVKSVSSGEMILEYKTENVNKVISFNSK